MDHAKAVRTEDNSGLRRRVGPGSATLLIVANMVGTGIFTTSGYIMAELGNPLYLLACWLLGGAIALCGALSYAELGARIPRAGGEYAFLRESFGPLAGFLSGWISLVVGFSAPIAAGAVAAAAYLLQAWPQPPAFAELHWGGISITAETLLALGLIGVLTILHTRSLRTGLGVQNLLTSLKLLVLVTLVAAGLYAWPSGESLTPLATAGSGSLSGRMATALVFVSFAYSGFNAAAYMGEEITNPRRNLPLALITGTTLVVILYLLLNLVYLAAVSPAGLAGVKEIGALTAKALFGQRVGGIFSLVVALCLLSSLGAMIMAGPRVYYAMARDRVFFQALGRVNPRRGVPANAIMAQSAIAALLVVTTSFQALLFYMGFTLSLFTLLAVAGLMVIRRGAGPDQAVFKVPGYPVTPLIYIAANVWMIIFALREDPANALPALGTLALGAVLYLFFRGKSRPEEDGNQV